MLYALVFVYIACYIMVSGIVSFITKALNERRWLLRRLVIKSFLICWSAKVGLLTKYVRKNLLVRAHWQQLKMVREVLTAKQLRDCVRYWSVSQGTLWNMSQKRRHPRNSSSLPPILWIFTNRIPTTTKGSDFMPLPRERTYTIDDIYALPDGERAELIDGQIYYMAPPSRKHQAVFGNTGLLTLIKIVSLFTILKRTIWMNIPLPMMSL